MSNYVKINDLHNKVWQSIWGVKNNLQKLSVIVKENSLLLGPEIEDLVTETQKLILLLDKAFVKKMEFELADFRETIEDVGAEELKAQMLDNQQDWLIATLPPFGNSEIEEGE